MLDSIYEQTNIPLIYPHEFAETTGLNSVVGKLSVDEALQIALQGTGFSGGLTESGVIVISRTRDAEASTREDEPVNQKLLKNSLAAGASALVITSAAVAQESPVEEQKELDTITVVGSYLAKGEPQNASSPVSVLDRETLIAKGDADITRLVFDLPVNQGSEAQPNIFLQNFSAGTSQFNLRGLGLASTLVLYDGKRSTLSAASAQDGSTFVDINTIPKIAIDGIDILKDGAAALYGSDAVAGVVNIRLREDFQGVEVTGSYQSTFEGDQDEYEIGAIGGLNLGDFNLVGALNYFKREPLQASDRSFTDGSGFSRAGQPANYILIDADGPGVGADIPAQFLPQFGPLTPDPDCEAGGGIVDNIGGPGPTNHCLFDFIQFAQLVIPEERLQGYASIKGDVGTTTLYANLLLAQNEVQGQTLPGSLPSTGGIVPAAHPNNPFGFPAVFIGRPFANNAPAGVIDRENDTFRIVAGANGELSDTWDWDVALQYSENSYSYNFPDVRLGRLNAALAGNGGPNNNEFFNPFGTASGNSSAVINDIAANTTRDGETDLFTLDGVLTGELPIELSGGSVGVALGAQLRSESIAADYDAITNAYELAYLGGADDFSGDRSIYAVFGELSVPFSDRFEVQIAGRFEDYEDSGSTFDPKIAARYEPVDGFTLRGSFSTTFRAPSLLQANGFQGAVAEILPGQFRTVLFTPNPDLENEEADVYNIGAVYESQNGVFSDSDEFFLSVDYWNFDYQNVITGVNPAQLVTQFNADLGAGLVTHNNLNTAPEFQAFVQSGGSGVFSRNNQVAGVVSPFVNAASLETDGVDVEARYTVDAGPGELTFDANATFVFSYDLTPFQGAATIDGLGQRNFFNFGRSNTDLRANGGVRYDAGAHSLGLRVRHLGSYTDEVNDAPIDSHTEVDVQYSLTFENHGLNFTAGATNLFDQEPPEVGTFFGFDTQTHDPRGALYYLRFTKTFGQ